MIQNSIRHFFLPNPTSSSPVAVNGIGIGEVMPPCVVDRPNGLPDYLLMIFLDAVQIGGPKVHPPNTAILWEPGHAQYYGDPASPWNHSWMHCEGVQVAALVGGSDLPLNQPFRLTRVQAVERVLLDVYREMMEHDAPQETILANTIQNAFIEAKRQWEGDRTALPAEFAALNQYVARHLDQRISLSEMAERVHMSRSHFSREFRRYTGMSPIDYVIRIRLQTAATLLTDRNRTISEVAREVGYEDAFLFTRQFKRRYLVSPRMYRQLRHP